MTRKRTPLTLIASLATLALLVAVVAYWQPLVAAYEFWDKFESLGRNEQGMAEYRHRQRQLQVESTPFTSRFGEADSLTLLAP